MRPLLIAIAISVFAFPQTPPQRMTVLRASRLLDIKAGRYIDNPILVIQSGLIKEIRSTVPDNAEVIDLGNATLMPGLIDCHTHLLENYDPSMGLDEPNMLLTVAQMSTATRALLGAKMGREALEAGITTVRDLGNSSVNGDVALRDAINAGWVVGPRMLVSTRAISAAGGQFGPLAIEARRLVDQEYAVIASVDEARKAVRQALYDGADCIKVIVNTGPRIISPVEMRAIVEEAHRAGKKVAAHAIGDQATRIAAEAGVDSIEHGYIIPDDVLAMMAEKKIFLVPTDPMVDFLEEPMVTRMHVPRADLPRLMEKQAQQKADRIQRAIKAGVRIASGADLYYQSPLGRGVASITAIQSLVRSGMTPLEALRAATINAADLLGISKTSGSLEPGKFADIISVDGDPLKDIKEWSRVKFVMKSGEVIKRPKDAAWAGDKNAN